MTKRMLFTTGLCAIMCLTLTVPAAHAGGGMGFGSGLTTCRIVTNGAPNQYQIAQISDDFLVSGASDTLKIGTLTLLCDLGAIGSTTNPAPGTNGTGTPVTTPNSVACYSVANADAAKFPVAVQDAFTRTFDSAGTYGVTVGSIQFVCVPALYVDTP